MNIQDWFPLDGLVGSPCSPRDSQESSPTPQFKSINSSVLSFLYNPTLAWKIPWMEEPGGLQSMGSLRVGHDWATSLSLFTFMHWRRKWQPTPVFLPGESQGRGSLVGCRLWGRTESDTTEVPFNPKMPWKVIYHLLLLPLPNVSEHKICKVSYLVPSKEMKLSFYAHHSPFPARFCRCTVYSCRLFFKPFSLLKLPQHSSHPHNSPLQGDKGNHVSMNTLRGQELHHFLIN